MKQQSGRPVWTEISLGRLRENYRWLAGQAQTAGNGAAVLAIVKDNAYGHSAELCCRALTAAGAEWLGVTSVEEGVAARAACPTARVLVISGPWLGQGATVLDRNLTPVVWEKYHFVELEQAAKARGLTSYAIDVHLELDTGMSRQGVNLQNGLDELAEILRCFTPGSPLRLAGLMTHLFAPEVLAVGQTERQLELLEQAVECVAAAGHRVEWLHAGNSAALLRREHLAPLSRLAAKVGARLMLRPGLALYGLLPRFEPEAIDMAEAHRHLQPVLSWKTRVVGLRHIPAGATAGYNATFTAQRPTTLALLPLGYGDGLRRALSGQFSVLIQGQHAPLAGRISMDQCVADVTDLPGVTIGDEVVLVGRQGSRSLSLYDHSDPIGAIPWEIPCGIAARVPRIAVE